MELGEGDLAPFDTSLRGRAGEQGEAAGGEEGEDGFAPGKARQPSMSPKTMTSTRSRQRYRAGSQKMSTLPSRAAP